MCSAASAVLVQGYVGLQRGSINGPLEASGTDSVSHSQGASLAFSRNICVRECIPR